MRPPTRLAFGSSARDKLASGIELVARAAGPTLGPSGRTVVMDSRFGTPEVATSAIDKGFDHPHVARDGLAIASEILIRDPLVNQGVALAREAARLTKRKAGDGSTTAILLTRGLAAGAFTLVAAGYEPRRLEHEIGEAAAVATEVIKKAAVPVDGALCKVVQRATNDDELGRTIADSIEEYGDECVLIERGRTEPLEIEVRCGLRLTRGAVSEYLLDGEGRDQSILRDCLVLTIDGKISSGDELAPVLEYAAEGKRTLLIIAHEFEPDALALLTVSKLNHKANAVAVVAPAFGGPRSETLNDVAILTDAMVIGPATGLELERSWLRSLGVAAEVTVTRTSTIIVGYDGGSETLDAHRTLVASAVAEAGSVYDRDEAETRRAELSGRRYAVLRVGGPTGVEEEHRRRRAEDGVRVAIAARAAGVVAGGGVALARAGSTLASNSRRRSATIGADVVARGLCEPLRVLASNSGFDGAAVVRRVLDLGERTGFDALTGTYPAFHEAGLLDPASVVCSALEAASFIASRALLTEVIVAQPLYGGRVRETQEQGGPGNLAMP